MKFDIWKGNEVNRWLLRKEVEFPSLEEAILYVKAVYFRPEAPPFLEEEGEDHDLFLVSTAFYSQDGHFLGYEWPNEWAVRLCGDPAPSSLEGHIRESFVELEMIQKGRRIDSHGNGEKEVW